jgi:hypothetical protein
MDHEQIRLDRLCAHVEEHGIGDLLLFLSFDEMAHIEARGSLRQFFSRNRRGTSEFPEQPAWIKEADYDTKEYLWNQRQRALAQVAAIKRNKNMRARDKAAQIEAIKRRYIEEMANAHIELKKEEQRRRRPPSHSPPPARKSYDVPSDLPAFPTAAQLGAMFDFWVSCL